MAATSKVERGFRCGLGHVLVLALCACGGGRSGATPRDKTRPMTWASRSPSVSLGSNGVPRFFPAYTKPCKDPGSLQGVMSKRVNPAFNHISELLFHDQRPAEDRAAQVADAAGTILGCIEHISHHPPKGAEEAWPTFDHFLHNLVINTHAVQNAALEDDLPVVVHWYYHVKQSCAACHARFWKAE